MTNAYRQADIANSIGELVKAFIFTAYLGCLLACIYFYAEWDAGRWSATKLWTWIGIAYGGVTLLIGCMAWLQHRGGFPIWSRKEQRGFDVIFKDEE